MTRPNDFLAARALWIVALALTSGLACVGCGDSAAPPAGGAPAPQYSGGPPAPYVATPPPQPTQYNASADHTSKGMKVAEIGAGVVSTPAKVYLRIPDQLVFDQVKQALGLYRATNGNFPKTQEEFMREIITANNLKLPELPEGSRYVYRAEDGELLIEEPGKP